MSNLATLPFSLNLSCMEVRTVLACDGQDNPKFPRPRCRKCNAPVEHFTVTLERSRKFVGLKFEVECAHGYEMVRVSTEESDVGITLSDVHA